MEFCVLRSCHRVKTNNGLDSFIVLEQSVYREDVIPTDGIICGRLQLSGYLIEPAYEIMETTTTSTSSKTVVKTKNEEHNPFKCRVTYLHQIGINTWASILGNNICTQLTNALSLIENAIEMNGSFT